MLGQLSLVCLSLLAAADDNKPAAYPRADLLIEAADLDKVLKAEKPVCILDVRSKDDYQAGRVPGAAWVDAAGWAKAFAASQDKKSWSRRLGEVGISPDGPVVVYDDGAARDAGRIWWIVRYWGVKDVRLLNGGWLAWREHGGKIATRDAPVKAVTAEFTPQEERLVTLGQLKEGLKRFQVIDARSAEEHCGQTTTAKRNGAIPAALHLEWSDLLDRKTHKFKSADELAKLFKAAGIDLAKPTVTYCQSGGRAAVMAFGLELMGAKDVRNYYKSWAEWGNAEDTPIMRPAPKK
jgi:thiosulfate/3-mercaptopyruvate sulfurtransferase